MLKPIVFAIVALFSMPCFAQDGGGAGYVGVSYGLSVPDSQNTKSHRLFGVMGGAQLAGIFNFGGYHMISSEEPGPNSGNFKYELTGLEGRFNLTTGAKKVYLGVRAGISKINTVDSGNNVIYSPYHYGIVSGYLYDLFSILGIGIEGSFTQIGGSTSTSGANTIRMDSFHIISFLGFISINF